MDFMAIAIVLYPLYIIIQMVYGIFLLRRALKTRTYALIAFMIVSIFMALDTIVSDLEVGPKILRNFIMMNYPICYMLFTKYAIYRGRKSNFKYVFVLIVVLRIIHFTEVSFFDHTMPPTNPIDTPLNLLEYSFHVIIISAMHSISLLYLGRASFLAHRDAEKQHLDIWITHRNLLIGFASIGYAIQPVLWILVPIDGTAYVGTWQGFFVGISIMIISLTHASISLLSWVMPHWFKKILNKNKVFSSEPASDMLLLEKMPELTQKALSTRETLLIVDFIGNLLAPKVKKSPAAAKGLLLLAVQSQMEQRGKVAINFLEFSDVIRTTLKARLMSMNAKDPDTIVKELLEEVSRNQYMILMMIT